MQFPAQRPASRALYLGFALATLASCSDSSAPSNPLPALVSVTPAQLVAGSGATTVTLSGSGFIPASQARWNDADRITHYQSSKTLTVDLLASDLATVSTGKFTVVNGAPGGGTSGVTTVVVGFPVPTITSVSPNTSALQSSSSSGTVNVTITGSGFVPQSAVRIGNYFPFVGAVTPTQIQLGIPNSILTTPGPMPITVQNPTPGGGASNAVSFNVTYPVPTISAVAPDSAFTGSAFTLTVNGTGFGPGSIVRWNGSDRATTFVSATRLTAAIAANDVSAATTATVTVFNPTPGGGTSNSTSYTVRERAPQITGISPAVISAGAGATTVTITGSNFRTGATVQWDGQNRTSSLTSATSMTVTLTASDLAAAHVGKLTVTNPGASGVSNSMAVAVVTSNASLSVSQTIALNNNDLAYDEQRSVLYASVPSTATTYANSIVRIDPSTGAITGSVAVGSNPGPVAITEDDQYLYVGLSGAAKIVRIALATFSKDIDIILPGDSFFGSRFAEDIVPIPGSPQTVAASTFYTGVSPRNAGAFLFDNDVSRTASGPGHTGSNRITRGPNGARIYGYNNETTEFGFRSVLVAADGLHEETVKPGLVSGFGVDIQYSGGLVYATTGEVVDPSAMQKLGTIPASGIVRPDAPNARVHFLNNSTISSYHYTAFTSLGSFSDPSLGGHTRLIRWGSDGLAAGGGSTIVLVRGALVAP